jgi:sulfatase modifying factor 1
MKKIKIFTGISFLIIQLCCSDKINEVEKVSGTTTNPSEIENKEKTKSGFEMVFIQGGEFIMGGDDKVDDGGAPELRIADECPHLVTVNDFHIGKYEVTQADWIEIMGVNPNESDNCKDCPVSQISWIDIQEFIKKSNSKFNENYRLPTEEEWEFAAKGGLHSKDYIYSGSNLATEVAWYAENSGGTPHPVGLLRPNELGIYDMSGNIWEWCSNSKKTYPCDKVNVELKFESKVLRGGTFGNRAESVRVRDRNGRNPSMRLKSLGFRLAK